MQRIRDFRFEHKGRRFTLGACAGVAPITQAATTAGDIMVQADMACYRAKSEGSGRVMLYEADEVGFRRLEAEMGWAADFAQALEANQFLPYRQLIQPTSADGQPHYEVLIRWQRNGDHRRAGQAAACARTLRPGADPRPLDGGGRHFLSGDAA